MTKAAAVAGSASQVTNSRTSSAWVVAEWIQSTGLRSAGSAGPLPPSNSNGTWSQNAS